MKVGTDGVLLGAWANPTLNSHPPTLYSKPYTLNPILSTLNYLDVGTGTGLIALMLAQRFPHANIVGIDIDEASIEQAKENVTGSPFKAQITLLRQDFNDIDSFSSQFDLIVSNPPFYTEDTLSGKDARDKARHTSSLPFETLVENAAKLLTENGHFSVIIPYQSAPDFISLCAINRLYLTRRTDVRTSLRKPLKRTLLEFGKTILPVDATTLTLHDEHGQRTPDYTQLTAPFYLL